MKKGITITQRFTLDNVTSIDNLTDAIFSYKKDDKEGSVDTDYLLIKKLSDSDITFEDGKFVIPLSQADTLKLTRIYYVEAQLIYNSGATNKWNVERRSLRPTLRTENVNGQSDGTETEDINMSIDDVFVNGGGTSTDDYNDLSNKPSVNGITLQGNKTTSDLGLDIETGDGLKRSGNVISVDLASASNLYFADGKLAVSTSDLGVSRLRQSLANTSLVSLYGALASKSYVDNLVSANLKYLVVETLPTQDIDTHTIYLVPKSTSETNNVYDEYMYINNSWELIGTTETDLSNYYTKSQTDNLLLGKVDKVEINANIQLQSTVQSELIDVSNYSSIFISELVAQSYSFILYPYINNVEQSPVNITDKVGVASVDVSTYDGVKFMLAGASETVDYTLTNEVVRERELTTKLADKQDKLTAGTNITIDSNNVISASGGSGSYSGGDGIDITNDTISVDLKSGSKLQFDNGELDVDLSSKQDAIDSSHKLDADLVDDSNSTNQFVTATEKSTWNGKADNTTISTDTTSTTVSLTLADNHEYRYTQDLTSLTLTMPSGDFISSIVFASGSTPTSMTYDSSIKWSGNDVSSNAFVPQANMEYEIVFWYNGLSINAVVRGV